MGPVKPKSHHIFIQGGPWYMTSYIMSWPDMDESILNSLVVSFCGIRERVERLQILNVGHAFYKNNY